MESVDFSPARLKRIFGRMQQARILVVGDLMLDRFVRGKVNRISPEAPVPVVHVSEEESFAGGAANVARNLAAFGVKTGACGILGRDAAGDTLIKLLRKDGIDSKGVFIDPRFTTIQKMRIVARHQQVVRVDWEKEFKLRSAETTRVCQYLARAIPSYDAVIVEDYGKGLLGQEILDVICKTGAEHGKIVAVDPNPNNPLDFKGATVLKPNRSEAFAAAGVPYSDSFKDAIRVGASLAEKWALPYLLITLSEEGMLLFQQNEGAFHTPTRAREVFDVSGAGDTAIAFFTAALAAGLKGNEAAEIANHAAGIVVSKLGTATLTPEELMESFTEDNESRLS